MYQPVYGYGQSSQQPQGQQPQGQHSPPEQYAYNQQSYSSNSNDAHNHTSLPNFSSYMSSQQQHSNTNSPTIPHSASMDKVDSPHLNHKSKDEYQQQQYSYNSSIRDISSSQQIKSPNQSNSNNFNNNYRNAPSYRHLNSSPATSPTHQQLYTHNSSHVGFNSDIITSLTQATTTSSSTTTTTSNTPNRIVNINNTNNSNELPTLPPLNTSSPQLNTNTIIRPRAGWISLEEKTIRPLANNNTMISHSPQQPDPSILVQYQNVGSNRDDRRLMSTPFPNPQQRYLMRQQQHQQHQVQDMFTEIGPYGCGIMGCFASFSISSGLFTHIKEVHKNIGETYKPYRCAMPTCPKRYKNINGLQYHLREAKGSSGHGHVVSEETSNVRPYHCQIPGCKKAYRTANGLRYHNQNGHLTGPPLQQMVNAAMQEQQHQLRMQHASPHLLQSIHQQVQTQQAHGHVETRAQATHAQQQQSHQSLPHFIGHPR